MVKVQNSKPPKAVADFANRTGLHDTKGHINRLLEQLMSAAKHVLVTFVLCKYERNVCWKCKKRFLKKKSTFGIYLSSSEKKIEFYIKMFIYLS